MKNTSMCKESRFSIRSAGLISGIALAIASGGALAEQSASAAGSAQDEEIITSTDEMQRLAQAGHPVEEGQLDPDEVARVLGEERASEMKGLEEQTAQAEPPVGATAITPGEEGDAPQG